MHDILMSTINKHLCAFQGGRVDHTHMVAELSSVYTFLTLNMSFMEQKKRVEDSIKEMHVRLASFII